MTISIITATYNSAKTLRDTLDSVLSQSYEDFELIIQDGGSKDETLSICRDYSCKFEEKLSVISEPDKGIYDAMNKGIARATGDVVGILNSDDFYTSADVLSTIAAEFENNPEIDAVYADVKYVDWNNTNKLVRYYSSGIFSRGLMRLGFMPAHPTFYCKKSVYERFKKNGAYFDISYKIAADFENLLRMIFVGRIKTRYIKKCLVTMRNGGASSSGIASHKQINKDHQRAFKENGVYSNVLLESLRYVYKVGELILGKIKR